MRVLPTLKLFIKQHISIFLAVFTSENAKIYYLERFLIDNIFVIISSCTLLFVFLQIKLHQFIIS